MFSLSPSPSITYSSNPRAYSYPFSKAIKLHLKNVLPLAAMYFIILSTKNLSIHFLRFQNDEVIAALGLASNISWVCFQGVFTALNIGMLSRLSQAYGAKDYHLMGFYFHRGMINNIILSIPLTFLIIYSDELLVLIGFERSFSNVARQYLILSLPGLYFSIFTSGISAYLNAADIFITPSIFQTIAAIIFCLTGYLFIEKWDMGISGAAHAFSLMNFINLFFDLLYIIYWKPVPGTLFCLTENSFQNLWDLFKHQFMVGSMMLAEWIFAAVLSILAGELTTTELAAWVAVYGNVLLSYVVPISLMDTTLTFVGNCMGEGKVHKAQTLLKAALVINFFVVVIVEIVYGFFGREIIRFYIRDPKAIDIGVKILRLFAFVWPPDCYQMVLGAGLRAIGKEKSGTLTIILGMYAIAIPLGYLLAFKSDLRVSGLVIGEISGYYFVLIVYIYITLKVDWMNLAEKIYLKLERDKALTGERADFDVEEHLRNGVQDDGLLCEDVL